MSKATKYYAVQNGPKPGVYKTWDEAKPFCIGIKKTDQYSAPKFKCFPTIKEAWGFVRNETLVTKQDTGITKNVVKKRKLENATSDEPIVVSTRPKKTKKIDIMVKPEYDIPEDGTLLCYTDGAASKNGRIGAVAGIGVYFPHFEEWNISAPLDASIVTNQSGSAKNKSTQTNQTSEIEAIHRALAKAHAENYRRLIIRTDSQFAIDCLTNWFQKWKCNGWKTSTGEPVVHKVQIQKCLQLLEHVKPKFEKVKGHSGDYGNERADALAVAGAARGTR